jgi:hypothetical protein
MMSPPADAVMTAIRGAALCVRCIARSADLAPVRAIGALAEIAAQAVIVERHQRCDGCGLPGDTHHLPGSLAQ